MANPVRLRGGVGERRQGCEEHRDHPLDGEPQYATDDMEVWGYNLRTGPADRRQSPSIAARFEECIAAAREPVPAPEPEGDVVERVLALLSRVPVRSPSDQVTDLLAAGLLARPVDRERLARVAYTAKFGDSSPTGRDYMWNHDDATRKEWLAVADAILREWGGR